ncbi:cytochrome P450 oxidoreductase [Cladophialophora yegresii CBS 114405]|uniref:Cytochrome P450 oxidoreductase n=1 Tax=Cladophialophora yegresii CBS 114405 TaxID=1182544 RepID=W9W6C4_9EURO|nr:cytochrome P450 oxidoreductase [Cladophialophora yegresii CBS 114405]EXJ60076.1 cytochrome P450 oxidoreductase [Cladophialophora yegresii CBS 114405]
MASTTLSNLVTAAKQAIFAHPILLVVGLFALSLVYNKLRPGLRGIPGPPVAAYTKLWRLYDVWRGHAHMTAIDIHKEYGPVVRIGPSHVSISDPSVIPVIYGIKENFTKTGFYPIQCISWKKKPEMNLFSTRDPEYHRVEKRKVGAAYSMPNLLQSEAAIDSCVSLFMSRLDEYASRGEPVDLGAWLQYFAFDVVGEVTFASKLGFLEQGKDVDGMMKAIEGMLTYAALCGQVPEMHDLLLGNPLFTKLMPAMETWNQVLVFTLKAINGRASIKRDGELINADVEGRDMLSRWAYVKSSDPLKMSSRDIIVHLSTNVFAGSDTTAIALRAIVYFLCRNPECMDQLVAEIDAVDKAGKLSRPISHKEATTELPYLGAVVKEAMRIHPSVGFLMERHVPAEGLDVQGYHIPAGTIVGINPWVTNRSPVFGPEPEKFNPSRWLTASQEQLKEMDNIWELNFGAGSRKCIGRNISWIEIHKVIPELLRRYRVELTYPEKEWHICNHWFVQQEGLICSLTRR